MHLAKCELRNITRSDLQEVLKWRNSDRVRPYMFDDREIKWETHQNWFDRLQTRTDCKFLLYCYDNVPLGTVQYAEVGEPLITWGFYLGAENYPKGSGRALGLLGLDKAFNEFAAQEIRGEALAENEASVKFHLKMGFSQVAEESRFIAGRDKEYMIKIFEITNDHWADYRKKILSETFKE